MTNKELRQQQKNERLIAASHKRLVGYIDHKAEREGLAILRLSSWTNTKRHKAKGVVVNPTR